MMTESSQAFDPSTYFTAEHLEQLTQGFSTALENYHQLLMAFSQRQYRDPRGREFALNGFLRRIKCMHRNIINVFTLLPPDRTEIPSEEQRLDAQINIQAFVFNTFGATDNLAWVWVSGKDVKEPNGDKLLSLQVGLRKKPVLASFPAAFRDYLSSIESWFQHLENFRHALAHRIPLYIPPHMVDPKHKQTYQELEADLQAATIRGDTAEYDRLSKAQEKLTFFQPLMTHSFEEGSRIVVFHAQLLADFNTVHQIACKMLEELDQ